MFVNESVISCIELEITRLEGSREKLVEICRLQKKDVKHVSAYGQLSDQLARLKAALQPLTNKHY